MNIVFLKSRMHKQGGLEKYLDRLARRFVQEGHRVTVVTSCPAGDFSHLPYTVKSLCSPSSLSWLHLLRFDRKARDFLKAEKADVVFGFDRHFLPLTHYRAGNGCHREYLEKRSRWYGPFRRALLWINPLHWLTLISEKVTIESPKTVIFCNSFMVRNEFLKWYPKANPSNICVIHNGVEWQEFEEAFRQRESRKGEILFIGNEWGRKGVPLLLQALALIKRPFHCTIVGKEKRSKEYTRMVHSLQLEEKVTLRPYHEKALPWYQRSDILALPSMYDPFANVTVEALAMGLWVVTSKTNGGHEVVHNEQTGEVVSSVNPQEWANAFERALERVQSEEDIKKRIRETARPFDFSTTLQSYVDKVI